MSAPFRTTHPTGEYAREEKSSNFSTNGVETFSGQVHIEWNPQSSVTPMGQLSFFIEFLKTSGLFDKFVEECPLVYTSGNAPSKRDVLGSYLLSVLAGHTRYAHMTAMRGDKVNAQLLGMKQVVSEDSARRAFKDVDEEKALAWLSNNLQYCYTPLLETPWILDIDATVKTVYGKQELAKVGYNPHKPGRPSHAYHSYFMSNIRIALDVELHPGNEVSGSHSAPKLWSYLDKLPQSLWPAFIRGDISYGTDLVMQEAEKRQLDFLFKLKKTKKVKELIASKMLGSDWVDAGQGFEGVEAMLHLVGWTKARRVIVLRRKLDKDIGVLRKHKNEPRQLCFDFAEIDNDTIAYEHAVLVTSLSDEILTISQHYRDRADSENNFDELKNQWGWCGFTTNDAKRCKIMAKMIALFYNWWTIFARLIDPDSHREAITTRPLLLHAIGQLTQHSRQKVMTITSTHAKGKKTAETLLKIHQFFLNLRKNAEQLTKKELLTEILRHAFRKFMPLLALPPPKFEISAS